MAVNKVILRGETLIDLTEDTVTPETLALGATAHDASGNQIVGEMEAGEPVKEYNKFVVVGVTGQSNSVGYDESPLTMFDVPRDPARIMQYSNSLKPLTYMAESIQMMNSVGIRNQTAAANERMTKDAWVDEERRTQAKTKGIHLPLANLICDVIPEDYGVLMVPGSYGGLGINSFTKGSSHYSTFVSRLKAAMNSNEENIFCGIIWCQGENNCGNAGDGYLSTLRQLITDTNNELQDYVKRSTHGSITEKDWYFYEWPVYYKNLDTGGILPALKGFFGSRYVPIPDETPHNTTMFTSGNTEAHFGDNSFRKTIAPRVFNAMQANGAFLCNSYDNDTIVEVPEGGGSADVDISNYVDMETYDTLNKRFTLTEKLLEQMKEAMKAGGLELNTKIKVTSDLMTGYGQFVLTETGANYEGPKGAGTYCKYTSEGYDTFFMDTNVQSNTTFGLVVAMNRETKEYLWIYSQTGAVMKNTDSPNANTFQTTNVGAQALNSALQTVGTFKFIREGTVIKIYKQNGEEWTSVKDIDIANALSNIGLSGVDDEKAAYVWGFCVGWSNTLNKQDSSRPMWDNLYVDNQ